MFFAVISVSAKTYTVVDVPNVHRADSTRFVSNPDGILSVEAENELNGILRDIRRNSSAEAVVVVVDDIEGGDIDGFATELFENWGLGKGDKDNGLLILVAKDLRRAAIRPGYGLEGVLPDITCGRILREQMFPRFKDGDYDARQRSVHIAQPEAGLSRFCITSTATTQQRAKNDSVHAAAASSEPARVKKTNAALALMTAPAQSAQKKNLFFIIYNF